MRVTSLQISALSALGFGVLLAGCGGSSSSAGPSLSAGKFVQTNLVSDQAGQAPNVDTNLVNAWGMSASAGGPFWISDNGTGLSTLYNGNTGATVPLVVTIPAAGGGANGPVSGQLFNTTTDFKVGANPAAFIFVNEDGVVSAWNGGGAATTMADRSGTGAVYKGAALGATGGNNFLYAANFNSGKVDVFDKTFTFTSSFTDTTVPPGYAPFGISNIGGLLYVTFAKQDAAKHDDVRGAGNGYVDVFNPNGTMVSRLISRGELDSPWGIVQAPAAFGTIGNALLVGNFGNGWINAYNITNGTFLGSLRGTNGAPLAIDGLWGLSFGNGGSAGPVSTLFFTAGPVSESHGLFGSLTLSP